MTQDDLLAAGCAIVRDDVPLARAVAEAIAAERERVLAVVQRRQWSCDCICSSCLRRACEQSS